MIWYEYVATLPIQTLLQVLFTTWLHMSSRYVPITRHSHLHYQTLWLWEYIACNRAAKEERSITIIDVWIWLHDTDAFYRQLSQKRCPFKIELTPSHLLSGIPFKNFEWHRPWCSSDKLQEEWMSWNPCGDFERSSSMTPFIQIANGSEGDEIIKWNNNNKHE